MVRAPLRVLPWSLALSGVLGGGRSGPGSSLPGSACTPCGGCVPRGWWGAVPGGRWPATVVRGVWCQALSLPRLPVLWGGQPGYRDPCVPGAVDAGVGTQHRFHSVRPCGPALLVVVVAEGRPRWAAFHWAGCWGPSPRCCGCGRTGVGAHHCPFGLHALWGLHAGGVAGGRPRGVGLPPLPGASGVRRCPSPCRLSSGAASRGTATRLSRVRSVRAW